MAKAKNMAQPNSNNNHYYESIKHLFSYFECIHCIHYLVHRPTIWPIWAEIEEAENGFLDISGRIFSVDSVHH